MSESEFKPSLIRLDSVSSTNDYAKELALKGGRHGSVIVARTQTLGRGTGERKWVSPEGGLYLSLLLYPSQPHRLTDLSLLAGVGLCQTVQSTLPKSKEVSVKWPNDCLVNGKKIGGILCESVGERTKRLCVVGIGLNVNLSQQQLEAIGKDAFPSTSFSLETQGGSFNLDEILKTLLIKILNLYQTYRSEGFSPIQYLWERNCRMIGKEVEIRPRPIKGTQLNLKETKEITKGTCLGIDEDGALVLSDAKGDRKKFVSGEISCFWR